MLDKFILDCRNDVSEVELAWLNIIKKYIDVLVPLGTAAGRRIEKLSELLETEKDSTGIELALPKPWVEISNLFTRSK